MNEKALRTLEYHKIIDLLVRHANCEAAKQRCKKLTPIVQDIIIRANQNHEINISDPETCASFCVFGQLGILMNNEIAFSEKSDRIKTFFNNLFNL